MQHNSEEQHTIYESQDLIIKNKEIEVISINDFQFDIFVNMLQKKMRYNKVINTIIY